MFCNVFWSYQRWLILDLEYIWCNPFLDYDEISLDNLCPFWIKFWFHRITKGVHIIKVIEYMIISVLNPCEYNNWEFYERCMLILFCFVQKHLYLNMYETTFNENEYTCILKLKTSPKLKKSAGDAKKNNNVLNLIMHMTISQTLEKNTCTSHLSNRILSNFFVYFSRLEKLGHILAFCQDMVLLPFL